MAKIFFRTTKSNKGIQQAAIIIVSALCLSFIMEQVQLGRRMGRFLKHGGSISAFLAPTHLPYRSFADSTFRPYAPIHSFHSHSSQHRLHHHFKKAHFHRKRRH